MVAYGRIWSDAENSDDRVMESFSRKGRKGRKEDGKVCDTELDHGTAEQGPPDHRGPPPEGSGGRQPVSTRGNIGDF